MEIGMMIFQWIHKIILNNKNVKYFPYFTHSNKTYYNYHLINNNFDSNYIIFTLLKDYFLLDNSKSISQILQEKI